MLVVQDQYKQPLQPGEFDFLPEEARNLLEFEGNLFTALPANVQEQDIPRMVVAHNVYKLGRELFGHGRKPRRTSSGETVYLRAYGTQDEQYVYFKVEGSEGTAYFAALPDDLSVSFSVAGEKPRKVRPQEIPATYWSGVGLAKKSIEEGGQIEAEKRRSARRGRFLQRLLNRAS